MSSGHPNTLGPKKKTGKKFRLTTKPKKGLDAAWASDTERKTGEKVKRWGKTGVKEWTEPARRYQKKKREACSRRVGRSFIPWVRKTGKEEDEPGHSKKKKSSESASQEAEQGTQRKLQAAVTGREKSSADLSR